MSFISCASSRADAALNAARRARISGVRGAARRASIATLLTALVSAPCAGHAQPHRPRRPREAPTAPAPTPSAPAPVAPTPAAPAATPDPPNVLEAREHQQRGRQLLEAGNFNAALAEFERVYALLEGHPRQYTALANMGRCHQSLGHYDRAVRVYRDYLAQAPADVPERVTVQAALEALDALLGTLVLTLQGPARAEVWVDERQIGDAPGALRVPVGRHVIELRSPGFLPARREVSLTAGGSVALAFSLERPAVRRGISRGVFFTGLGLTAVAGTVGAVFGGLALAGRGAIDARIALDASDPQRYDVAPEDGVAIAQNATLADVFFIATGVLAVGTGVVALFTDWRGAERAGETRESSATRSPAALRLRAVSPSNGGLVLVGSF